ncbi:MAG TPA: N-acetylglucosamine-6-phosphate deacetylase [Gammaproteobacteria bacterium]|nr:N-acetylglucosamine-6-phosphate deacetylase [Gammaproteobacteria bacterium]
MIISGPQIYAETGVIKNADLIIDGNKIQAIHTKQISSTEKILFPENYHLVPGFIDVHIHGANGFDVMDGTFSALEKMSETLAEEGTTSYLATTMTAPAKKISQVLENAGRYMQQQHTVRGAKLLGVHLEGPFLSPQKIGAQNVLNILRPEIDYIRAWQEKSLNAIRMVTLAPELPNSLELIRFLCAQKIVASIGHTNATYEETLAAVESGCTHATHLFNAMRGIHHREPGVAAAALLSEKLTAELIVDGVHLHPAIVQLAVKTKGKEKIVLVTDAMRAKCLKEGVYDLGGQQVEVKNNIASLPDGTLAGSTLKMFAAVKNMMKFTRCDLWDAVQCAANNPAKLLGVFAEKGSILPGKDADLVVLDDELNVVMTIVQGEVVFRQGQYEARGI